MAQFLWICLGGAMGTGSRYLIGSWANRTLGNGFPFGTLIVNAVGSFLISVVMYLGVEAGALPLTARLFLTTGFLGGFTTYSTFNYETIELFQSGDWSTASANVAITLAVCTASGLAGLFAAARLATFTG